MKAINYDLFTEFELFSMACRVPILNIVTVIESARQTGASVRDAIITAIDNACKEAEQVEQ